MANVGLSCAINETKLEFPRGKGVQNEKPSVGGGGGGG